MPFRRRRFHRRRPRKNYTRKRGATVSRALRMYRIPKNKQPHFHVRRINIGTETNFSVNTAVAPTGEYLRSLSFKLNDLENYGELTSLYDQYMITKVVLDFQWTLTAIPSSAVTTNTTGPNAAYSPQLNLIRDYTDSGPAISQDFRESGRVIRRRITANNPFRITLTPAVASKMYDSAVSTGYDPKIGRAHV